MPDPSFPYFHVSYLDASAAVKLVVQEPGSENLLNYYHPPSGPRGGFHITTLCFAEALGVLKRKWQRGQLSDEQYLGKCYMLVTHCSRPGGRITLEEPGLKETFMQATRIARTYKLDLSDALQLLTVKHGKFRHLVEESKTLLITADRDLAAAAKAEGLRVWNCRTEPTPPSQA
jgi:predicted nucleic acid-binding protein